MKKIGITGGIGSGKSTVCRIFETLGIPVYDADTQAKKIMITDMAVKCQIRELIGKEAYYRNGKLNKDYVSSKIFSNKSLLQGISQIVHPAVNNDSLRWMEQHKLNKMIPYVIKEAALLIESGNYKALDKLIVVTCPEDIRIQRVIDRDKLTYEEVKRKVDSQIAESEKLRFADFIIVNDGTMSIINQVRTIHMQLTKN